MPFKITYFFQHYPFAKAKGWLVKIIPKDIFNLLEPVALAHWIQGDGKYVASGGLRLCTDSYTIQDVVRLINVLMVRYELICTVHKSQTDQYQILIWGPSPHPRREV
jgi:hypothetical protein